MKKLLLIFVVGSLSSCSGMMVSDFGENDRLVLYGSEKTIRAFSDRDAGIITNSKASSDTNDTPYYQLRREQGARRFIDMSKRGSKKNGTN